MQLIKQFDGTGRTPRPQQVEALEWVARMGRTSQVMGIQAGCGCGKQAIAMALLRRYGGAYMTASNVLVGQALDTYPTVNYLIGKSHYTCKEFPSLSCEQRAMVDHRGCGGCKYQKAKQAALSGAPTIYNPISYYYSTMDSRYQVPRLMVVDEADNLLDTLMLLSSTAFGPRWAPPQGMGQVLLVEWMRDVAKRMTALRERSDTVGQIRLTERIGKIEYLCKQITDSPDEYVHWYNDGQLFVSSIDPPREIIDRVIKAERLVLMSATLFKDDIRAIVGHDRFDFLSLGSPIPKERRPVLYEPSPVDINYQTDPKFLAELIKRTTAQHPSPSTIVHVTYSRAPKLAALLPGALSNTKETKDKTLAKFKREGGLWLAAGCAEGLDLYDDYCRLNIILRLHKPNLADTIVQKKLSREGGRRWYDLMVLRKVIQQAGRSTRHETDSSKVVIKDTMFPRLFKKYKSDLPPSFVEAVQGVK